MLNELLLVYNGVKLANGAAYGLKVQSCGAARLHIDEFLCELTHIVAYGFMMECCDRSFGNVSLCTIVLHIK